ncbi:hypothetical protein [Paenibacillus konkukensis]|nr:hypothetical protein [Paenibacillus konkukensis]
MDSPKLCFVAFIDLLGFSNMVKQDLEAPNGNERYIEKLYDIHQETLAITKSTLDMELNLIQFSDSVVLATPFIKEKFEDFLKVISRYQHDLFCKGILSRGGIAYGKHFYKDGFMFSLGLIEAYRIESNVARFPRIVVSSDLMELIYPEKIHPETLPVIEENDGQIFLDYLSEINIEVLNSQRDLILRQAQSMNTSIREKYIWLMEYINHKRADIDFGITRFK